LAARMGKRKGGSQKRSDYAETQGVDLRLARDVRRYFQSAQHTFIEIIGPGGLLGGISIGRQWISPRHQKHRMTLLHGMTYEGVLRLQIENVVLVDTGRYNHQGTRIDPVGKRRVLNYLEQRILINHRPRRNR